MNECFRALGENDLRFSAQRRFEKKSFVPPSLFEKAFCKHKDTFREKNVYGIVFKNLSFRVREKSEKKLAKHGLPTVLKFSQNSLDLLWVRIAANHLRNEIVKLLISVERFRRVDFPLIFQKLIDEDPMWEKFWRCKIGLG